MKLEIIALIDKFEGIQPTKNGFKQRFILLQPELKNEFGDMIRKEQYFPVEIFSKEQTDKRFIAAKDMRRKVKATVYCNGERWLPEGKQDFQYFIKFSLKELQNA